MSSESLKILLVEGRPVDVVLFREAFATLRLRHILSVAKDGETAVEMLRDLSTPLPDLIVLDLNLPGMSAHEFLGYVKGKPQLRQIPVAMFSAPETQADIDRSYDLRANCCIQKPSSLGEFVQAVRTIQAFWAEIAELPPVSRHPARKT